MSSKAKTQLIIQCVPISFPNRKCFFDSKIILFLFEGVSFKPFLLKRILPLLDALCPKSILSSWIFEFFSKIMQFLHINCIDGQTIIPCLWCGSFKKNINSFKMYAELIAIGSTGMANWRLKTHFGSKSNFMENGKVHNK